MNAWRLMMIIAAPWMLFCALRLGLRRRRSYVTLALISVIAACIIGAFCLVNTQSSGTILGFPIPKNTRCFGPFISRNHAGVYFYLHVALALALTFWHIRRAGESSLQGGPYLITAFLVFALSLLAALTTSVAATTIVLVLILLSVPLAYYFGFQESRVSRRGIVIVTGVAMLVSALAVLFVADFSPIVNRFEQKANVYQKVGSDDRAPLRRATLAMISDAGWDGRAWVGYGAGSYRWISPLYQAEQKELHYNGRFYYRADYAHNDWLEMLATWGVIGMLPVVAMLGWLGRRLIRAFHEGHPETMPLALGLILLGAHASLDLLFWFTPLMFTAVFIAAAMTCLTDQSSAEMER
jgi:O-antigen ligase